MWTIRPLLEQWADVAWYDPPGVGEEPLPGGVPRDVGLTHALVAERGLNEIDGLGWDHFFLLADSYAIAAAAHIAKARQKSVTGLVFGHARLSFRRQGPRAPVNGAIWEALTQVIRSDYESFIRHGIAQATAGSVDEDVAGRMLERIPHDLMLTGWEQITAEDESFAEVLGILDCPFLLAKHEGCLMSTDEGFEDVIAAFPDARALKVPAAPSTSPEFAEAVRSFCEENWPAGRQHSKRAARPGAGRSG
jgi:hypothetical protein